MTPEDQTSLPHTISVLGCGWLGQPLATSLLQYGYSVLGSTTTHEKVQQLKDAGIKPFLIRFAPGLTTDDGAEFFDSQVCVIAIPPALGRIGRTEYFLRMRSICNELTKGRVSKVLLISSTSVYNGRSGEVGEQDANEASELFEGEQIFTNESAFDTTVIRFSGLVGPGRHPSRFLSGKEVAGGNDPVNLIHLTDCVGIIERVIRRNAWGTVFNACALHHPTRKEFYELVCRQKNVPPPVFVPPHDDMPRVVSTARLQRELGYVFAFPDPMKMTY